MTKELRDLKAQIMDTAVKAKLFMEGEEKDLAKAEELLNKADELQKEYDLKARMVEKEKAAVPAEEIQKQTKADGFKTMAKMMSKRALNDTEKAALITGEVSTSGESYLVPEDVKAEINELRKTYISAKNLVTVVTTDALAGSVTYEAGTSAGLLPFDDGDEIVEEDGVKFELRRFAIKWVGKLIPVSRILLGAEKAGLMSYLDRWFVRNAIYTENSVIFAALGLGYFGESGLPKAIVGWKALKKSINKDLDPACLTDGVIVTNQSGFAALDEEEDKDGRPVLQPNPAHPTEKLFQGLPIKVFPDTHLPNIDDTHFPIIYGSLKAGATFVEHQGLEFAVSDHFLFNKNQTCLRVIEGFDVMSTDKTAYIYGSFSATV